MADDPNPTLSAALVAARHTLAPQIRGLGDLAATTVSPELRGKLQEVQAARQFRDGLIESALFARDAYIAALGALEDNGYPDLPAVAIPASLVAEIAEENADLAAATSVFSDGLATAVSIGIGAPVPKSKKE